MENVILKVEKDIAYISFNRPKALNALNLDSLVELNEKLDQLYDMDDIHFVIFYSQSKAFVAGADISEMRVLNGNEGRLWSIFGQKVMKKIEMMDKITIAAVDGYALGGGCELAMACDLIYGSYKSKFGQPEVSLGIIPGFSGTYRLTKRVGPVKAKELILTGRIIEADEAEAIGLINELVDVEFMPYILCIVDKMRKQGPLAIKYAKHCINHAISMTLDEANTVESTHFGLCFASEDQEEGMEAFLCKRKAEFNCR